MQDDMDGFCRRKAVIDLLLELFLEGLCEDGVCDFYLSDPNNEFCIEDGKVVYK